MSKIDEALNLHPDIKKVIDNPDLPATQKHTAMAKVYRTLLSKGIPTGLDGEKPAKGSSRAVYFPAEPDDLVIDGHPAKMKSVLKIAFPGALDKHNDTGNLFGEHQNWEEGDYHKQREYGALKPNDDGSYSHNPEGILAPVIHTDSNGHYLHMGQVRKFESAEFKELTKTPDFPKGISHTEFQDALIHEHNASYGKRYYGRTPEDKLDAIKEHPLVSTTQNFMFDHGITPHDFDKRNMGIWEHPVTGHRQIVLSDYGVSHNLGEEYDKARKKSFAQKRNNW